MSNLVDRFIHQYGRLPTEFDTDYLEMLNMSKYRILAVPDLKPGKCANCGSTKNDGRKYVDFGLEMDWYGIVFLCGRCLHDIGKNVGLFKEYEDRLATMRDELLKLNHLHFDGAELDKRMTQIFEEVKDYYARLHAASNNSSSDSSADVVADAAAIKSGIDQTESGTSESTSVSGSKNVRSLTDFLATE